VEGRGVVWYACSLDRSIAFSISSTGDALKTWDIKLRETEPFVWWNLLCLIVARLPKQIACPACNRPRPPETASCPGCDSEWPAPVPTGLEILSSPG